MKGYLQVYTGDGKGKTTAAMGTALRALMAGWRVYIGQFLKNGTSGEILALQQLGKTLTVEPYGHGGELTGREKEAYCQAARAGFQKAKEALLCGNYDLVILVECNVELALGYLDVAEVLDLLRMRPEGVECILTGRGAIPEVVEMADLVTEMKEIKHYFAQGVMARKGIEE